MQAATRNYRPRQPTRSRSGGSGLLLGLFLGFLLGLGVSAAIAIYLFKTPVPFINRTRPPEEPVTGEQLKAAATREKSGKAQEMPKDTYFLQAGAFQNPADADNLKARL